MSFSLKDFCVEMKSEINTRAVCIYYSCVYWLYIFLHRTWIVAHCSCWLKSLNLKFNKSVAPHVSCNANDTVNSKSIQRLLFELDLLPKGNPVRILSAGVMCTHEIWTEWKEQQLSTWSHWPLALPGLSEPSPELDVEMAAPLLCHFLQD